MGSVVCLGVDGEPWTLTVEMGIDVAFGSIVLDVDTSKLRFGVDD